MRELKYLILLIVALIAMGGLYGFASYRASKRLLNTPQVRFTDYANPLLSEKSVLDILKISAADSLVIDSLDLHKKEKEIIDHPMVRDAQLSVNLQGNVQVEVEQRVPVARIMDRKNGFIDADYTVMPLSAEFTPRVPLIHGYTDKQHAQIIKLVDFIRSDAYLKDEITQVVVNEKSQFELRVRKGDYRIELGGASDLHGKFMNYRAFLASKEKEELKEVATIDLRFKGQVITTNNR